VTVLIRLAYSGDLASAWLFRIYGKVAVCDSVFPVCPMGLFTLGSNYSAERGRVHAPSIGQLETRRDRRNQRRQWSRQILVQSRNQVDDLTFACNVFAGLVASQK